MAYIFAAAPTLKYSKDTIKGILRSHYGIRIELLREASIGSCTGFLGDCNAISDENILKLHDEAASATLGFDLMYFADDAIPSLHQKGALVLDMDMTSVQIEGIDEIARRVGVYDQVAEITSQAMHGGLDFATSLKKRVAMLKDGNASVINEVKEIMTETEGLDDLMEATTYASWKRGICSGGFVQLICVLEEKYKLDMVCANSLEIVNGKLTGRVDRDIVDAEAKRQGVLSLLKSNGIPKEQCVVLGDGANDLLMIDEAGLGIAYHAKPLVRQKAAYALNYCSLSAVSLLLKLYA